MRAPAYKAGPLRSPSDQSGRADTRTTRSRRSGDEFLRTRSRSPSARSAALEQDRQAFTSLLAGRFKQTYRLTDAASSSADLTDVGGAIDWGEIEPNKIGCRSPEWVAARLWDRALTHSTDLSGALRLWVDRWDQLGSPALVPGRAWNETAANAFRETAMNVLGSDPGLVDWDEFRVSILKQTGLARNQPPSSFEEYIPPVPATLVDRALWLCDQRVERNLRGTFDACDDIFGLANLLLADVLAEDPAPAPHKIASKLFALAVERPELLLSLLFKVRWNPMLLADLLLNPQTSVLACLLIAQWQSGSGAWDRELRTRDDQTTKAIAFADAVSAMGHFLERGSVPPEEVASLLDWIHKTARPGFIDDLGNSESMLATLRGELVSQSPKTLQKMVAALTAHMPQTGLGTSTFAASLDIIDVGKLAGVMDPLPLIAAYIQSMEASAYTLSANRISVSGAVTLFELAMRAPTDLRQKFLSFPFDIKNRLAAAVTAGENPYTVTDTIARSIRAHIRILCRASIGSIETPSGDLAEALIAAVRSGALGHEEKGRIAAFAARYESHLYQGALDRPIAADVGGALAALTEPHRDQLLSVILETDEPIVLAQLSSFAPHTTRSKIEKRITDPTPSEAGTIYSLTTRRPVLKRCCRQALRMPPGGSWTSSEISRPRSCSRARDGAPAGYITTSIITSRLDRDREHRAAVRAFSCRGAFGD